MVSSVVIAVFGVDSILGALKLSFKGSDLAYIFAVIINFLISTTSISSVSVSLEGKTIWLLRSLPISANQVFLAKLAIPLILVLPTTLIASIIFGILLNSVFSALIIFGITLLFLLITDIAGIMINLWFPKLNWENETQVVKQSLSVLLSMVLNAVLALVPVAIYLIFKLDIWIVALIGVGFYACMFVLFTSLLFTKGKKIFYKLEQ